MLRSVLPGLVSLSLLSSCASVKEVRRLPGPERELERRVLEERTQGPLVLELESMGGRLPDGLISGRVYRETTCTTTREVEAERTVTIKRKSKGGIGNLIGGVVLTAAGIAIIAAAQGQSDRPKEGDKVSPRNSTRYLGTVVLIPGLGLTGWGTTSLIRARDGKEEIHYTRPDGKPEVSVCERSPVGDADVSLSSDELGIALGPVTKTNEEGEFSISLVDLLPEDAPSIETNGDRTDLLKDGLLFPLATDGQLHLRVDAEELAVHEQLDTPRWLVEPFRQVMAACSPPSTTGRCDEVYAALQEKHAAHPGALTRFPATVDYLKGNVLGRYRGGFQGGMRHGRGKLMYADGRIYTGQFAEGYPHGKGKSREPSGTGYDGQYQKGSFHGKGTLLGEDGTTFTGIFNEGKPAGRFVERRPNGFVFEGEMNGTNRVQGAKAIVTFPTGHRWTGRYNDDLSGGHWAFTNPARKTPGELYVIAGRHIDQEEIFEARLILRYIADKHPKSAAATRAVDRLADLQAQELAEERFARQLQADLQADREAESSERAREQATCRASCSGLEGDGKLFNSQSRFQACLYRCADI